MFNRKKKLPDVRILDVPMPMLVGNTYLATQLPNGKTFIIHGNFTGISDADANFKLQTALTKLVA